MFKDIKEYPGYKINENGIVINKNGHMMRPALSNVGRPRVALETYDKNGKMVKRTNESIYRLVAKTFIPNPDNLPLVMHLDNDVLHNHVSNLKWGTQKENVQQALNDGLKNSNAFIFEVYNEDKSDVIKCKGQQGVCDLLGIEKKKFRLGKINSGEYKNYTISNTNQRVIYPVKFI